MRIKNIVFDVGNVFVTWDPYAVFLKYFKNKEEIDAFFKEINFEKMILDMDKGVTFAECIGEAVEKFPQYQTPLRAYDREWIDSITGEVAGTYDMMTALEAAGYQIYGLSNFAREKFDVCAAQYPFANHFKGLVVSSDVGEIKPDEKIYKILIEKYNIKPEESVFLDDRADNIETAKKLGFKTVLFTTAEAAEKELKNMDVIK
ncbi:epoxide hydrolase-like predicted phosphatase [Elusimicrobium simillimum]|uniref:HAD family hydrolase n=1 Tax=Elusimicrobium simillimum TaxID=3143438 RepID=UPI003C6F6BAA